MPPAGGNSNAAVAIIPFGRFLRDKCSLLPGGVRAFPLFCLGSPGLGGEKCGGWEERCVALARLKMHRCASNDFVGGKAENVNAVYVARSWYFSFPVTKSKMRLSIALREEGRLVFRCFVADTYGASKTTMHGVNGKNQHAAQSRARAAASTTTHKRQRFCGREKVLFGTQFPDWPKNLRRNFKNQARPKTRQKTGNKRRLVLKRGRMRRIHGTESGSTLGQRPHGRRERQSCCEKPRGNNTYSYSL